MSGKLKFKVLRPVGISGRKERGEIVELTLADAENIGGEYLKAVLVDGFGKESDNTEVVLAKVEPEKTVKPATKATGEYKAPAEPPKEEAPAEEAPAEPGAESAE